MRACVRVCVCVRVCACVCVWGAPRKSIMQCKTFVTMFLHPEQREVSEAGGGGGAVSK